MRGEAHRRAGARWRMKIMKINGMYVAGDAEIADATTLRGWWRAGKSWPR